MNHSSTNQILSVQGIRAGYHGVPVLRDINLEIKEGSCIGVLGHNGMGKTTLLRAIMGFIPLMRGSVRFDDRDISNLEPWQRARLGFGYLPQGRGIFADLTVEDNLCMAYNPDTSYKDERVAVNHAIARFPLLEPLVKHPGGTLSGGEQQILALARALIAEPILLLLDEPTEGIQPSIVKEITAILSEIRADTRLTIVLVEQNSDFVHALADEIIRIENGSIIQYEQSANNDAANLKSVVSNSNESSNHSMNETNKQRSEAQVTTVPRENSMTVKRPTFHQIHSIVPSPVPAPPSQKEQIVHNFRC